MSEADYANEQRDYGDEDDWEDDLYPDIEPEEDDEDGTELDL